MPFLYAPVQLTVLNRFPSNFQDVLRSPSCITYSSFFAVIDLRSVRGYDVVMLSLWETTQITPIRKILEISASFYHFCSLIPQYITLCHFVFLCLVYISKGQVKWGYLRCLITFVPITGHIIKIQLPKWHHSVPLEQPSRLICNIKHFDHF